MFRNNRQHPTDFQEHNHGRSSAMSRVGNKDHDRSRTKCLLIIGGGISGLSAAYYAKQALAAQQVNGEIVLVEASDTLGGAIRTLHRDGFVIEQGPDSFLARKKPLIDLACELGLADQFVATNRVAKQTFIVKKQRLHRFPKGLMLGVPTRIMPFLCTPLISPIGKIRALLDLILPRRPKFKLMDLRGSGQYTAQQESEEYAEQLDELQKLDTARRESEQLAERLAKDQKFGQIADVSLGDYLANRVGSEVLHQLIEPIVAGIYAGHTEHMSLQATFPQFQQRRSLIIGSREQRRQAAAQAARQGFTGDERLPAHVRDSVFLSFQNGLSYFVDRLVAHLNDVEIKLGVGVERVCKVNDRGGQVPTDSRWADSNESAVERRSVLNDSDVDWIGDVSEEVADEQADGVDEESVDQISVARQYEVILSNGSSILCDAVIAAIPPYRAAPLLEGMGGLKQTVQTLHNIKYASVANVVLAYDKYKINHNLNGSGFVVPRKEGLFITACTWVSSKWPHVAPTGKVLIRCYIGRIDDTRWMAMSEEEIVAHVKDDLCYLMGIDARPLFHEIQVWPRAMPQYPVDHLTHLDQAIAQLSSHYPGLLLTGAGYYGVGLPDCIQHGKRVGEQAVDLLRK